jgi:hypothetical protein
MHMDIMHDTPVYQLAAFTALTAANIVVAITSLTVAYRNYFGSQPMLLPGGIAMIRVMNSYTGAMSFGIVNSRQYPIALKYAAINFPENAMEEDMAIPEGWIRQTNELLFYPQDPMKIDKLGYQTFRVLFEFKGDLDLEAMEKKWKVQVAYLDPLKGKDFEINTYTEYTETSLTKRKTTS